MIPQPVAEPAGSPLTLRAFAPADYDELISWFPADAELELFTGVAGMWPLTTEKLEQRQLQPGVRAYSAVLEPSTLAGHVELVEIEPERVRFVRVAVAPRLRGHGLVGHLLDLAFEEARGSGATTVELHVVPGNVPALRSYERAGFVDAGKNPAHPQFIWMTRAL